MAQHKHTQPTNFKSISHTPEEKKIKTLNAFYTASARFSRNPKEKKHANEETNNGSQSLSLFHSNPYTPNAKSELKKPQKTNLYYAIER